MQLVFVKFRLGVLSRSYPSHMIRFLSYSLWFSVGFPPWVSKILFMSIIFVSLNPKTVYDHDTFSKDDKMGDAEFDIKALVEAMGTDLHRLPSGVTVTRVEPSRQNCLAEASSIKWTDKKVSQDLCLRLRNVECGEVELSLHWVDLPATKAV